MMRVFSLRTGALGLLLLFASPAAALPNPPDLKSLLRKQGSQALVVRTEGPGCQTCARDADAWADLEERHWEDGLEVLVLRESDEGRCRSPEDADSQVVCDPGGRLREALAIGASGEAALWSWRGERLLDSGGVKAAARAFRRYLDGAHRVVVEVAELPPREAAVLQEEVEKALAIQGKLTVVVDAARRAALAAAVKGAGGRQPRTCKRGEELSASTRLLVRRQSVGGESRLFLAAHSIESACQVASVSVGWDSARRGASISEATDELVSALRDLSGVPVLRRSPEKRPSVPTPDTPAVAAPRRVVKFTSKPRGAMVFIDGAPLCQATPCTQSIPEGPREVSMRLELHETRTETVEIGPKTRMNWKLSPAYGTLVVTTKPRGIPVLLNGVEMGETPVKTRVAPGAHLLTTQGPCHEPSREHVTVDRGRTTRVKMPATPRASGLAISASDGAGNDLAAQVSLDGKRLGLTPGVFRVALCSKKLVVKASKRVKATATLSLKERQTARFEATLNKETQVLRETTGAE